MSQTKQVEILRVVVGSPGDVQTERDTLPSIINELNLWVGPLGRLRVELFRWETDAFPSFHPEGPQGLIDSRLLIQECDIFIGIFWKRFGTPVTDAKSGTEHEFNLAYQAWKQKSRPEILFYFNQKAYKPNSKEETDQWGQVLEFQRNFPKEGLWWPYKGMPQFEDLVRRHLTQIILTKIMPPGETAKKTGTRKPRPASSKLSQVKTKESNENKIGKLRLDVVDVYGKHVKGKVSIHFRNSTVRHYTVIEVGASTTLIITDLYTSPDGHYWIQVNSSSYLPVGRFVNIRSGGITDLRVTLPMNSLRVKRADFPKFELLPEPLEDVLKNSNKVLSLEGKIGKELYCALDDLRKANLLNITAKARITPLSSGNTIFSHIKELSELRANRVYAIASKELLKQISDSVSEDLFRPVSGALHIPPAGFNLAGSFKTKDYYGALQLTFFLKGDNCVVDMDIDDGMGMGHFFQSLRDNSSPRSPFDIHEVLVAYQAIDPGYLLFP